MFIDTEHAASVATQDRVAECVLNYWQPAPCVALTRCVLSPFLVPVQNIWHSTLRCKDSQKRSFLRTYALAVHDHAYDYATRKAMFDIAALHDQALHQQLQQLQGRLPSPGSAAAAAAQQADQLAALSHLLSTHEALAAVRRLAALQGPGTELSLAALSGLPPPPPPQAGGADAGPSRSTGKMSLPGVAGLPGGRFPNAGGPGGSGRLSLPGLPGAAGPGLGDLISLRQGGGNGAGLPRMSANGPPGPVLDLHPPSSLRAGGAGPAGASSGAPPPALLAGLDQDKELLQQLQQLQQQRLPGPRGSHGTDMSASAPGRAVSSGTGAAAPGAAGRVAATLDAVTVLNNPALRRQVRWLPAEVFAALLGSPALGSEGTEDSVLVVAADWLAANAASATTAEEGAGAAAAAESGRRAGVTREQLSLVCSTIRLAALSGFYLSAVMPWLLLLDESSGSSSGGAGGLAKGGEVKAMVEGAGGSDSAAEQAAVAAEPAANAASPNGAEGANADRAAADVEGEAGEAVAGAKQDAGPKPAAALKAERAHVALLARSVYDTTSPWYTTRPRMPGPAGADGSLCFEWHISRQTLEARRAQARQARA
eukprot:XP_001694652.1 predicted protein [Chlamydomonas reinhardtii]